MASERDQTIAGLGRAIAAQRARAGLTQAELARAADVHLATVAKIECEMRMPSLAVAARLARALRVTVDAMLRDAEGLAG